ncbi:MAG TPA: aldo/keto reductase [bacterium]|nr:aldo/keto reductase [bacterium]HOL48995.1 aldo/keto reductase [bacterium]HPO52038.1 aldo/keto reductase [bacterium]HXK44638.1 aldo/keto reductase [bacterium]
MKYIQLGKTDLIVSRICFGCWQLSPRFWGNIPLDEWNAAMKKAMDCGINFVDTAQAYGDGFAESVLGDFMSKYNCRKELIIATKFYWNIDDPENRYPDTGFQYIINECEASLKRLKTDWIDLYQIHAWDPLTNPEEVAAALLLLKKQGKIRWIGVSNMNVHQMNMYIRYFDIDCLQPLYNILDRDAEKELFPFCLEKKIGVITYSSLARGILTGKYSGNETFEDSRANHPRFTGENFRKITNAVNTIMKPVSEKLGITVAELAVRWILTHPAVTSAIVGVKKVQHIESVLKAPDSHLDRQLWHKIANEMANACS